MLACVNLTRCTTTILHLALPVDLAVRRMLVLCALE